MSTASTSPLSLHDALPIFPSWRVGRVLAAVLCRQCVHQVGMVRQGVAAVSPGKDDVALHGRRAPLSKLDRKSTRLNSSHTVISYAVFCLKKKTEMILAELT